MSLYGKVAPKKATGQGCADAVMIVVFAILFLATIVALMGIVLTWAWNLVLPDLLGWPAITAWQGIGITTLFMVIRMLLGVRYGGSGIGE